MVQARRSGTKVAVMFVDLDRFQARQRYLRPPAATSCSVAAQRLQGGLRETDTSPGWGDDIVLLTGLNQPGRRRNRSPQAGDRHGGTPRSKVRMFSLPQHRCRHLPQRWRRYRKLWCATPISPCTTSSPKARTDLAISPDMGEISSRRFALENEIRRAIEHNQFDLSISPRWIPTRRVIGCEALIRWVPSGEGNRTCRSLSAGGRGNRTDEFPTDWVIERACRDLNAWRDAGMELPAHGGEYLAGGS